MEKLRAEIKKGIIGKAYFFCGNEVYIRDTYINKIKKMILQGDFADMNFISMTGSEITASQIDNAVSTLPFMAEKRLVIVKDSNLFASDKDDREGKAADSGRNKKSEGERLQAVIENMPDSTVLIFAESKVDKRGSAYRAVSKKLRVVNFEMPPISVMPARVKEMFKERNIEISLQTAEYFVNSVEYNMSAFNSEIDKLSAYANYKGKIDIDDIDLICTKTAESKIFTLIDDMMNKNTSGALKMYRTMLANKESPIMILVMISRQFRNILRCKDLQRDGRTVEEIAKITNQKEYPVKKCLAQGRSIKMGVLTKALKECFEFDRKIKTGLLKDETAVEMLIIKYSGEI